jgi:trk system potassium uptake protein TrkH
MSLFRPKALHPNHIVIGAFLLVVLAGTILLSLPVAGARGPLALIDALFTSASAVCVTGLVVVDTGRDLSRFGQIVTIVLIQIGGLGITTFSTFFIYVTGGRMSLRGRGVVETTMTQSPVQNIGQLLLKILVVTLVIEAVGAVLLYPLLTPHGVGEGHFAVFTAVYHSVSAFCNAGFSLYSTNLAAYRNSAGVSLVICTLVILGGLGFVVVSELWDRFLRRRSLRKRLSLHARLVLTVTAALLVVGTAMVFLLEGNNTLAGMLPGNKLLASFFQATTPRTAGFNTIPIGACGSATLLFMMILMFIGASPGSCGGGIKTTSFAVLLGLAVSRLKGTEDVNMFSRRVPDEIVSRAISVAFFGGVMLLAVIMLLCVTETALQRSYSGDSFLALVFEAVSAFGTVGLSTGVTPSLSAVGKLLIIVLMMVGRLGPLTIAIALAARESRPRFRYACETVMIG